MSNAPKNDAGIAIVGMSGLFPKARNLDEFWRNLCEGVDGVSFFSEEELADAGVTSSSGKSNCVRARAIIEDADFFDAAFFGMNPKEAELTDPQHRLFLECAWQALENANCDPQRFGRPIGVFAGMSSNTYLSHNLAVSPQLLIGCNGEFQAMVGNDRDFLPTRVSYKFNLKGPSLNIQTACSTSLVAVCVACQHLLTYQCDLALAGAVSVSFPQKRGYVYQEGGITSPDGHCRPFDVDSAGTVAGEGVGVVALKRLEDALADGDAIYAVIKGFATNNDGALKIGYTAPSVEGQADVIAMAQAMAGFDPETISYVEAHGTGTPLGDPIEIEGLTRAFRTGTSARNFCAIGSVKGNIGHLDTAAGVAGLIKTALMLHHKKLPPSPHFKSPNPRINFAESPFHVNAGLAEWKNGNGPRRAGVSSFGIGGTNAHVVLEEAPASESSQDTRPAKLLMLSAKTKSALYAAAKNLARHLDQNPGINFADVAYTLQTGRRSFEHRAMLVCHDANEASEILESCDAKRVSIGAPQKENLPVVFMFPGQGAQGVNMGRKLYETEPAFQEAVDRCSALLEPHLGFDLRTVLYPSTNHSDGAQQNLNQTAITQPAMFVVEYALAKLWMSWGVQPSAMIGHSIGEYVAACLAGVFSIDDALKLIAARGRMMQSLPPGTMLAVRLPEPELRPLLKESLSLAAVNSTGACVVSGTSDVVEAFSRQLAERNIGCVALKTSHAFHSAMMEPILGEFTGLVQSIKRQSPQIPFISNVTGTWITAEQATDPSYWATHLRQTVRFADGLSELFKNDRVFLEVGPGQTLSGLARQHTARKPFTPIIASLARSKDEARDSEAMLGALGQLWLHGVSPAWDKFYANEKRRFVWLPTYPFERKRYWVEPARRQPVQPAECAEIKRENGAPSLPDVTGITLALAEKEEVSQSENQTQRRLRALISHLSGLDPAAIEDDMTFTQLGFDSLFLTQASVAVERDFGVRVAFRHLLEEFSTVSKLAEHIDRNRSPLVSPVPSSHGNGRAHCETKEFNSVTLAPLTESQREIWFASQISEAASCVYNECRLLHLRGPLQMDALNSALQKLIARHEALRTTFASTGDVQRIHPTLKADLPLADWSQLEPSERALRLDAAQVEEARKPFDLVAGPLIRARLIRLATEHHVFVLTIHHLVCDGYSFGILLRELGELYSAERGGGLGLLSPPMQFGQYALLQSEREQSSTHTADEKYWLAKFAADAPVLELPTDRSRAAAWKFDGAREWRTLAPALGEKLKRLSANHGCTLFTTMFAAYTLLLRKLSGQTEIIVGVPLADRAMADGETLVGHCVNFLPLRGTVEDNQPFIGHLAAMQKVFLDADEHGCYAFGTLLQKLNLSRHPSRMPLVSATFNLERVAEEVKFSGLRTELAGNVRASASFDVSFDVTDAREGLQLNCRYNADLFLAETIQRWLAHFETLLEAIANDPGRLVRDLPLLTDAERRKILVDWNHSATDYPRNKCVHQIFEEQAAQTPNAVAVEFEAARLTYRELNERANRLARYLQKHGVGAETVVAVCLDRSLEMIVALLGILKAGSVYLPLDPSQPKERLALMLCEAGASTVLTQEQFRSLLTFNSQESLNSECRIANPTVICLPPTEGEISKEPATNLANKTAAEKLAYISFTSGSTGKPKGVCIPHRAVVRLVKNTNYASFSSNEVFLQLAPLAFDASTFESIWGPLLNGARLVLFPSHAPSLAELGDFISTRRITTLWLTAGLFHQMIEEQVATLRGVRQLLAGGDVLSVSHVKRALRELPDCRIINGYGPTENTTFTCCHLITKPIVEDGSIPIGRPIANTRVYVLDENQRPVPIGVAAELFAGGDGLARGYLNHPELTAEKFIPNPFSDDPMARLYRTGDLVRWLPDGSIEFLGRLDSQVKVRGNRVEPGEIEAVLNRHSAVCECAVIPREGRAGEKRLIACYVSRDSEPSADELREHLRRSLPEYMVPSAFVRLASLPLTSTGKVDRKGLLSIAERPIESSRVFIAAHGDLEQRLTEVWREVLEHDHVGANDDFFELGGHSLLALRLIAEIEKVFGKKIPVASIFHTRTVAQMANLLREKSPPPRATTIVEIQPKGSRPPLMLVHGAGGGMFWGYTTLAQHLGEDQPVFAFKSRDVDGQEEAASLEEMARHYLVDLRAFQPRGPYYLGGYCFGGNVAYEMARQLRDQGEEVGVLALINCMPPNSSYDRVRFGAAFCAKFLKNLFYWSNYVLHLKRGHRREFLRWKLRAIRTKLAHAIRLSGTATLDFDIEDFVDLSAQPEGRRSLWEEHVHALFNHRPKPYPGNVALFRTRGHSLLCSFDEAFGWRDLAEGGVTVRIVSGAHESIMSEPHVRSLARELREFLDNSPTTESAQSDLREANCVHQLFERQAARTPDAVAATFEDQKLSYAELNRRADALATRLRSLGVGPDVPVGICLERSLEMVVGVLAILKAGGAYVPLDPAYPKERLKVMLENSRPPVLLTKAALRDSLTFHIPGLALMCVDEQSDVIETARAEENRQTRTPSSENLAYVIHTSGSTGTPKGVAMPHRSLVNLINWQLTESKLGVEARTLQFASLSFDVSFQEMFSTWCAGGTLVLIDEKLRRDPVALLRFITEQKIERLFLPFVALQQIAEAFGEHTAVPSSLREVITAGEQLQITPRIVKLFESLPDCTLFNHYGPSESHVVTSFTLSGRPSQWPSLPPIGRAIPSARIHLLNEQRQTVADGESGEIYIGGDCLAQGYLHRPDLTAEKFISDPSGDEPNAKLYKTGDLGRSRPDGNIEFLGRMDHQVKIRGFRIELGEIEATMRQHSAVGDAVVVAREDQPGNKRLVAYFICRQGQIATAEELRKFLDEKLPEYMVPSQFVKLESWPLTPSGKVDRKSLPVPAPERNGAENLTAPRTPVEKALAEIWSEVLGLSQIGIDDNFFHLGGHSLLATQVISRMRRAFQVEVPFADFFESPTIAALAEGITRGRWKAESAVTTIPREPRPRHLPLSYSQQRLWFIHQLEPGNFAYNVPAAVALDGELKVHTLENSLNELVRRHEILRTTFADNNGEPVQVVSRDMRLSIPLTDLSGDTVRDSQAQTFITEEAQRPFGLSCGPLIRCSLLRMEERKHIFVLVMHHIISDGWSLGLFFSELAHLYQAQTGGQPKALSSLAIQYADYALWQRSGSQEEIFKKQSDYWKRALANAPSSLNLPTDRKPSGVDSHGAHCSISISPELVDAVQQLNRRENITPFMTLLTGLAIVLNKWTSEKDIVLGTVAAGRSRPELESLIGCFMNFLPLRLQLQEDGTGLELLGQARAAVLESQTHQECPFEKIIEAVKPERKAAHSPLYNVGFLFQNFPQVVFAADGITGKFIPVETDSALLDLRFVANENEAGYSVTCEYRPHLFERETIEWLLASLCKVLETLVEKLQTTIAQFAIVPELAEQAEKSRTPPDSIAITATFTADPLAEPLEFWMRELELPAQIEFAPYNQVFQQLLDPSSLLSRNAHGLNVVLLRMEDWARISGGNKSVGLGDEVQIERTLGDFLSALQSAAQRNSTPILLCVCPPSKAFAARADFHERMHSAMRDALQSTANVRMIFPEQLTATYPVDEFYDPSGEKLGHVPYTPVFFAALATLIARNFSSQKRPAPKAIVLDCDQTLWKGVCGEDGPDGVELDPPRRALQEFMREQLEAGRLLCLCSKNNPEDVRALFERRKEMPLKMEHFAATRINWRPKSENLKALAEELNLGVESFVLVDDNPMECAEVQANCPGASALLLPESPELIPQFLKHCWMFDRHATTTEDKHRTDFYRQERERAKARTDSLNLQDFLASLDLRIQIEELTDTSLARAAQLTQRTNQFNCTTRRRTERELQDLLTGDDSMRCQALTVSVSDRFGDYGLVGLVILRFESDTVAAETFLLSCRALGRGVEHKMLSHLGRLAADRGLSYVDVHFVSSAKNKPALEFLENVGAPLRPALNGGHVFRFSTEKAIATSFNPGANDNNGVVLVSRPTSAPEENGHARFSRWRWIALEANDAKKIQSLIDRKAGVRKQSSWRAAEPTTEVERQLCRIWQELLRIEGVGIHDNFFELGGHSLLAVRLFAQIEKQLHVKLPLVTIFQSPTVEQLVKAIGPQASESCLLPIQPEGDRPPLFLVHGAGGDVLWGYANLAHHTNRAHPIYGIRACGAEEFSTLEDMAAHYVKEIRAFQPAGPYYLGGYCFGGNVAQEMARQIEERGERVAVLALLDCAPSNCGYESINWRRPTLALDFTRNLFYWFDDFLRLKREERRSLVWRKLRTLPRRFWGRLSGKKSRDEFDLEEFIDVTHVSERETRLWKDHLGLLVRHVSKPYAGHITLFRTRGHPLVCSFEEDFGWGTLAARVTVTNIPGSHEGTFLEPHVRVLAEQLDETLRVASEPIGHKTPAPSLA